MCHRACGAKEFFVFILYSSNFFSPAAADTNSASSNSRQGSAANGNNQSPGQDRLRPSGQRSQSKSNSNLYNYYHDQQPGTSSHATGGQAHSNQRLSQPLTKDQDAGGSGNSNTAAGANYPHPNNVPTTNTNNCDTPGKPMVVALNRTVS